MTGRDSFGAQDTLEVGERQYRIHRLSALEGVADLDRLPYSIKLLLENLLRHEDGVSVEAGDVEALARFADGASGDREIAYSPARILLQDFTGVPCVVDLAAMRDGIEALGGRAEQINPLVPVDLVIDHSVVADVYGRRDALAGEHGPRVRAQRRALPVPALGAAGLLELPGRASRHRHLPPVQPRVPEQRGVHRRRRRRLPRHRRRNRLAHADGERPRRAGVGRRWHRGRGGHARPADLDARAPGRRAAPHGRAARGHDGNRPRPDRRRAAAASRRRRQVRRVLRPWRRERAAREPGHDRQHVAGVRLDGHDLPDRQRDSPLSPPHRPPRGAVRARRGVREEPGAVARGVGRSRLLRADRARPVDRRAEHCRPVTPAGPRAAAPGEGDVRRGPPPLAPGSRSGGPAGRGRRGRRFGDDRAPRRRQRVRPRARPRRHRRHHELHEHLEPAGDDRRRPRRQEGRRARARVQALGEDEPRAGISGRHGLSRAGRPRALSREARLRSRRLRLHDVHRQLGPAASRDLPSHQLPRAGVARPCSQATATSRDGSTPTSG